MLDLHQRRKWWTAKIAEDRGREKLASILGYADTNYLNQVVGGHTSLGNSNAKKWAERLGLASDYFDQAIPGGAQGTDDTAGDEEIAELKGLLQDLGPEIFAEEIAKLRGEIPAADAIKIAQYFLALAADDLSGG